MMRLQNKWMLLLCFVGGIFFTLNHLVSLLPILFFTGLLFILAKPCFRGKKGFLLCLLAFAIGCGYGALRLYAARLPMEAYVGKSCSVIGIVEEAHQNKNGCTAFIKVEKINTQKTNFRIYLQTKKLLEEKDRVQVVCALKEPTVGKTSMDFDNKKWLMSRSTFAVMYPNEEQIKILSKNAGSISLPLAVRNRIIRAMENAMDGNARAFSLAVFAGKKEGMDASFKTALSKTGLSHVTAVSGLHVSLVISMALGFFFLIPEKYRFFRFFGCAFIAFFVLMVGSPASAVRAGMMHILYVVARIFRLNVHRLHTLIFVGGVMVLVCPFLLSDIGFQMSFMAVLGLFLFYERLEKRLDFKGPRMLKKMWHILLASVSASVFIVPMTAYYYGTVPFLGMLGNLVLLPMLPLYMGWGFLYALAFWILPQAEITFLLGEGLRLLSEAVVVFVEFWSKNPLCAFTVPSFSPLIILSAWLCALSLCKNGIRKRLRVLGAGVFSVWLICWLFCWFSLSVTVFPAGDTFAVVQRGKDAVVIGCGAKTTSFDPAQLLKVRGIYAVDAMYLPNTEDVHIAGTKALLEANMIKTLYVPRQKEASRAWNLLLLQATQRGVTVRTIEKESRQSIGSFSVTARAEAGQMEIRVCCNDKSFLFAEETPKSKQKCAVLKMPTSGITAEEMRSLAPQFVFASEASAKTLARVSGAKLFTEEEEGISTVYFTPWFLFAKTNQ